ncbi:MAG: DNA alkylation repair protein [bacterium]|nr:DNA alkylation repair protein [bacterium]MCM1375916.1 DNA alkylation repair protein [Muribaculum sp.]
MVSDIGERIQAELWELQDNEYKDFHAKLIPTVAQENIIGVRTPQVRKLAKKWAKDPEIGEFLAQLPHRYYDENNVHAFVVEQIKDYEVCLAQTERFLPYIDNWATCDMMAPKVFGRHREELLEPICRWIASGDTYTVRYGIGMLMRFYLEEDFKPKYLQWVAEVSSQEYYVNMMRAWYFATALAKQYEAAVVWLEEKRLDAWTHNKAIQKACESLRVTAEQKKYLRGLKVQPVATDAD